MQKHPENEPWVNELIDFVESMEVVDVWCKGCGAYRKMNANYAKHIIGGIENCGKCRGVTVFK